EAKGTYLESHFKLLIRVFVWGLIIAVLGLLTSFIGIGLLILIAGSIWLLYYLVVGLIRLLNDEPAPNIFWFGQ
ncbi:MAG: molecular chaperone DnaJ, partial [Gammaproteobacteria bacterium]|nr:molecular chaperone DnaJ [Gammaproteobacteria bacterium]